MRLPDKERPGQRGGAETGPGNAEARNLTSNDTSVIAFPRSAWMVPMLLARRIARTPPPLKPTAVRCWRLAVQALLERGVRP